MLEMEDRPSEESFVNFLGCEERLGNLGGAVFLEVFGRCYYVSQVASIRR